VHPVAFYSIAWVPFYEGQELEQHEHQDGLCSLIFHGTLGCKEKGKGRCEDVNLRGGYRLEGHHMQRTRIYDASGTWHAKGCAYEHSYSQAGHFSIQQYPDVVSFSLSLLSRASGYSIAPC
jgi:hypothetical protein